MNDLTECSFDSKATLVIAIDVLGFFFWHCIHALVFLQTGTARHPVFLHEDGSNFLFTSKSFVKRSDKVKIQLLWI